MTKYLTFFLNGEDTCRPPIYISTGAKYSGGLRSDMKSHDCSYQPNFPYNLAQEYVTKKKKKKAKSLIFR